MIKKNTLNTQYDKDGRPFKNIAVKKDLTKPSYYEGREQKWHWVWLFKYLDTNEKFTINK